MLESTIPICNFLKDGVSYMNPVTGSVEIGEDWEYDFENRDKDDPADKDDINEWELWGGDRLIEVFMTDEGWEQV